MNNLYGFKDWLIESVLQQEAIMRFSQKYPNQDVNDVPSGFWTWLIEKMKADEKNKPKNKEKWWTPAVEDDDGTMMTRDKVLELANLRAKNKKYSMSGNTGKINPVVTPPVATPPVQQRSVIISGNWLLAKVIDRSHPDYGKHVVITPSGNKWTIMNRKGVTTTASFDEIKKITSSVRDSNNVIISARDPEDLWKMVKDEDVPEKPITIGGKRVNPHILGEEKLKEEQRNIDKRFEKMMASSTQDHMMINALAGTGKTTILKHLAWKYGNPRQKWLYLVFNKKNRAEAQELKDGYRKFPDWVEVHTTNSFLNHLLKDVKNLSKIPQTKLMATLSSTNPQKVREIVDHNSKFRQMMLDYGLQPSDVIDSKIVERYSGITGKFNLICVKTLKSILGGIEKEFKKRVIKLVELSKAFVVNPEQDNYKDEVIKVFKKYDTAIMEEDEEVSGYFDTYLSDVKERINSYDNDFKNVLLQILNKILGYDFIEKDYKEEIIDAASWVLQVSTPHSINQEYKIGKGEQEIKHNLGDLRDFSDDFWYSAIYSDKLHWGEYDVVLADEVQDFNQAQLVMLKKLHDSGAKIVAVGDPNQAIYRFRGADSDAFFNLGKMLQDLSHNKEGWQEEKLSRNFRSRPNILKFANEETLVNNLIPGKEFPEDEQGIVTKEELKYDEVFNMIQQERKKDKLIETAFISRTNAPLVHAALKLLGKGIPFIIVGKDVAEDLINHINFILKNKKYKDEGLSTASSIRELKHYLIDHEEYEKEKNTGKATKEEDLKKLSDTTLALTASIDNFIGDNDEKANKPIYQFINWLKAKLKGLDLEESEEDLQEFREKVEDLHPVVLTTAHKSKGLEFSRVFILDDQRFRKPNPKSHPEDIRQEKHAQYVAYTRAMDELHIIKDEGQPGK